MAVNRTIYTQGAVSITAISGTNGFPSWLNNGSMSGGGSLFLSGVQSANFTVNSPKLDVSAFGLLGTINKVQVEPQTAQLEVSLVVNNGNASADPTWLSGLVTDAIQPLPSGVSVNASGVGEVSGAVLTSIRLEASVGALPTLSLTFDGVSGHHIVTSSPPSTFSSITVPVTTPDQISGLKWANGASSTSGCPRTVRASWEFPVERILCLGNDINKPTIFSRPPGTLSFTAEGVDNSMITSDNYLIGMDIGPYAIESGAAVIREVSRTANMAVGEAVSTYNVTSEGVALGAFVK